MTRGMRPLVKQLGEERPHHEVEVERQAEEREALATSHVFIREQTHVANIVVVRQAVK